MNVFEVRIVADPIDPVQLQAALGRDPQCAGAQVCFAGFVRGEGVEAMHLEHYPGMTERSIGETVDAARSRWPLLSASVVHRVGELPPGEPIVWVGVLSRHRAAAFAACEFIMDYLKIAAPLWKRERRNGRWHWVEARQRDVQRAARWRPDAAMENAHVL